MSDYVPTLQRTCLWTKVKIFVENGSTLNDEINAKLDQICKCCQLPLRQCIGQVCPRASNGLECIHGDQQTRIIDLQKLMVQIKRNAQRELELQNSPDWYAVLKNYFTLHGTKLFFEKAPGARTYNRHGENPVALLDFIRNVFLAHWNTHSQQWDRSNVSHPNFSGLMANGKLNKKEIYHQFWGVVLNNFLQAIYKAVREELNILRKSDSDLYETLCQETPCLRCLHDLIGEVDRVFDIVSQSADVQNNLFALHQSTIKGVLDQFDIQYNIH
jgi:hypothetical protein